MGFEIQICVRPLGCISRKSGLNCGLCGGESIVYDPRRGRFDLRPLKSLVEGVVQGEESSYSVLARGLVLRWWPGTCAGSRSRLFSCGRCSCSRSR